MISEKKPKNKLSTDEQIDITVEMQITLSTALEEAQELEGIGEDDNDNDADLVPMEDSREV